MEISFVIVAAIVMILGSALQSAAGFGFGMFAIPLLILMGRESFEAIAIISMAGLIQTLIGMWHLRMHIVWKQVIWMIAIAGAMVPLGTLTLGALDDHVDPDVIRQIFGGIVMAWVVMMWLARVKPRDHLHWGWGVGALTLCGYMSGMSGMGGPPFVLWVMSHTWTNRRSRGTIWTVFAGITPMQWFFLHQRFGDPIVDSLGVGLILSPFVLLGLLPGMWIGHRIPKSMLRQIAYVIILLIGAYAIVQPWVM